MQSTLAQAVRAATTLALPASGPSDPPLRSATTGVAGLPPSSPALEGFVSAPETGSGNIPVSVMAPLGLVKLGVLDPCLSFAPAGAGVPGRVRRLAFLPTLHLNRLAGRVLAPSWGTYQAGALQRVGNTPGWRIKSPRAARDNRSTNLFSGRACWWWVVW